MGETSVTHDERGHDATETVDGRVTRGARTREAVVDALLSLLEQGHLRPTAREIAAEAGVSLRSVYVHFDDVESLFIAAASRHGRRMAALLPPVEYVGALGARLDLFIERRRRLNEEGAAVRRAAVLQEPFSRALHRALKVGRDYLSSEVANAFAPEIGARPAGEGDRLRLALVIAASGAAWEALRTQHRLSADEAEAQLRATLLALVHGWAPAGGAEPAATRSQAPAGAPDGDAP
ncbi:MAG TPA: TetR/AcrR family transcriptional regulator [Acidimicrobiales bacterium]